MLDRQALRGRRKKATCTAPSPEIVWMPGFIFASAKPVATTYRHGGIIDYAL